MNDKTLRGNVTIASLIAILMLTGCGGGGGGGGPQTPGGQTGGQTDGETGGQTGGETGGQMGGQTDGQAISLTALGHITSPYSNPTAEDLLDHWSDPAILQHALGTSALNHTDALARISTLTSIFQVEKDPSNHSLALLRNVDPEEISAIGTRDGITYGQWTSGPAGGLNIEFDWRFAQDFDADARARMERAGKSWSWRILDDFGTHTLARGFTHHYRNEDTGQRETVVTDEDLLASDLLILVVKNGETGSAGATRYGFGRETTQTDYEPWFGVIELPQDRHNQTSTMAHEM